MRITKEMIAEDEQRWHARDVVTELGYCSTYMRDRKDITNLDIRFYAYIMRRAHEMLKRQEQKPPIIKENSYGWKFYYCPSCGKEFYQNNKFSFCEKCGQAVRWE